MPIPSKRSRLVHLLLGALCLLTLPALVACQPIAAPTPIPPQEPASGSFGDAAEAVEAAVGSLAADLGLDPQSITVVDVQPVDWPDACLGVTRADEACGQVVTPGYIVTLAADGQTYNLHTNASGTSVRRAE